MRFAIVSVMLALTVSASMGQTLLDGNYPAAAPVSLPDMHRAVSSEFNDPASAQYKQLQVAYQVDGVAVICGFANFRNSAGGYDDFAPFIVEVRNGAPRATIPSRHASIQYDIVAHSPCGPALGLKPLIP